MSKMKKNRWEIEPRIALDISKNFKDTTRAQTISNRINHHGQRGRVVTWIPFIRLKNKCAKEHAQKVRSFGRSFLSSDESKFNFHGLDGREFIWRMAGEVKMSRPEVVFPTVVLKSLCSLIALRTQKCAEAFWMKISEEIMQATEVFSSVACTSFSG